ncbi:hypothetical protein TrVFT333_005518 [Trichoderma virens FT-333]|nr:hypothetical protein TrVFT333_005518 [Trichoderma virens FT-333]
MDAASCLFRPRTPLHILPLPRRSRPPALHRRNLHRHNPPPPPSSSSSSSTASLQSTTLWDRKTDGGFPETKELKRRVRDVIDPSRDLGHVDRDHRAARETAKATETAAPAAEEPAKQDKDQDKTSSAIVCEDCT